MEEKKSTTVEFCTTCTYVFVNTFQMDYALTRPLHTVEFAQRVHMYL